MRNSTQREVTRIPKAGLPELDEYATQHHEGGNGWHPDNI